MHKEEKIEIDNIYSEKKEWKQNLGDRTIHAKRIPGKFRNLKWLSMLVWLPFFIMPYIEWHGRQSILFDIDKTQYHIFNITIYPEDLWVLVVCLLLLAGLLAAITTLLGRVFCGYLCFQTVWTDVFTKIEHFFEGTAIQQRKDSEKKLTPKRIKNKILKHITWLAISLLTGITWMLYFGVEWVDYLRWELSRTTLFITAIISGGAYIFAGFMREQTCLWLCPYARIQGVMVGKSTKLPTYDYNRGEPRGKLQKKTDTNLGDCIDCNQCVAVCPTGVDIKMGQEYGCITCGLCIDACDTVMESIGKRKGLIRYMSLNALNGQIDKSIFRRKRLTAYIALLLPLVWLISYGVQNAKELSLSVVQERQPLFIKLSTGEYRNKYELKIKNKGSEIRSVRISIKTDGNIRMAKNIKEIKVMPGAIRHKYIYLLSKELGNKDVKIVIEDGNLMDEYSAIFFTPRK